MKGLISDDDLDRLAFVELLNQNNVKTGVDTKKAAKELMIKAIEGLDKIEDVDVMEKNIPMSINELEEKGKECLRLAEPDYYAGNGLSPLEAFKKGLLSRDELIGFIKGNIIKYVIRAGHKKNASEDMVKAIDYCRHLKELYEKEMI